MPIKRVEKIDNVQSVTPIDANGITQPQPETINVLKERMLHPKPSGGDSFDLSDAALESSQNAKENHSIVQQNALKDIVEAQKLLDKEFSVSKIVK
ncbi:MAG: hypothetical protein HQM10_12010 [Candidatus Riflebacteria bacterium]|nr:hypothetical protein [Candidatus Riflebacteria bacterium]